MRRQWRRPRPGASSRCTPTGGGYKPGWPIRSTARCSGSRGAGCGLGGCAAESRKRWPPPAPGGPATSCVVRCLVMDSDLSPEPVLLTHAAHRAAELGNLALAGRVARTAVAAGGGFEPAAAGQCARVVWPRSRGRHRIGRAGLPGPQRRRASPSGDPPGGRVGLGTRPSRGGRSHARRRHEHPLG